MRIYYDDDIFLMQRTGGISRYFVSLFSQFDETPKAKLHQISEPRYGRNLYLSERHNVPGLVRRLGDITPLAHTANKIRRARTMGSYDLHHATYYSARSIPKVMHRTVVTIHDMTPELFPELFPEGNPHREKEYFYRNAAGLIFVSKQTLDDAIEIYGKPTCPIEVIPLGVGKSFHLNAQTELELPNRYFLYVGSRSSYKQFHVLLNAMSAAKGVDEISLVLVGGGALTEREARDIRRFRLEGRIVQVSVDDQDLPGVYRGAEALVFPSLYEGFGLPVLEAMATGCPVITSDAPALLEVAGDASLSFPAGDHDALSQLLGLVSNDSTKRSYLAESGLKNVGNYSWARTADSTLSFYEKVADTL